MKKGLPGMPGEPFAARPRLAKDGVSSFNRSGPVVVIPLHAFGGSLEERLFLGILDDLDDSVIHRPGGATDPALHDVLIELVCMEMKIGMFMVLAHGALHDGSPFAPLGSGMA
jgi:hypothetical protein